MTRLLMLGAMVPLMVFAKDTGSGAGRAAPRAEPKPRDPHEKPPADAKDPNEPESPPPPAESDIGGPIGNGTTDNVQRIAVVDDPAKGEVSVGQALTPGQLAGLEPIDAARDAEQAENRDERTNRQTDHEADNALDPVSGGPTPGVTQNAALSAVAAGAPVSDESGRVPLPASDEEALKVARQALRAARNDDEDDDGVTEAREGWRTPQDLGVPGAVMARIHAAHPDRIEVEEVPGGAFFPETGKRYRLK